MGFSVVLASFIVLIGFVAVFSTVATVLFTSIQDLTFATNDYINNQRDKINTQMQLSVDSVAAGQCQITVKNTGSKTIFLENSGGFNWNSVILAYGRNSEWHSYTIEMYTVEQIKITGTNTTLNVVTHNFLNPGEEATLSVSLPAGAPAISSQNVVAATFASYYGTTASSEGVME